MKTHRCKGSLEAKMSIRYDGGSSWWLYKPVHDFDWDTYYLNGITKRFAYSTDNEGYIRCHRIVGGITGSISDDKYEANPSFY